MRAGFVTCVKLGLGCMEEIYNIGGSLDLVITLHDYLAQAKSGRVYVDNFCLQHNIPVIKMKNINEPEAIRVIIEHKIDWLFIIGWSQIAKKDVLEAPNKGCLGMHPTLLPEGRGRAAIPWAILKGLKQTGVTLFKLDEGVDTGPIIAQEIIKIEERETATTLYEKVINAHKSLMRRVWPILVDDKVEALPQRNELATYWPERKPEDGRILPEMKVEEVDRLVRAVTRPYPGAFIIKNGEKFVIWSGVPRWNEAGDKELFDDSNEHLWIKAVDGYFEACEWEKISDKESV